MGAYVVSTAATDLPFDTDDARAHCRIDSDEEDDQVEQWIRDSVEAWESYTGVLLMPQTLDLYLDCFPREILLSRGPISSIAGITYVDGAGDSQTLSSSEYQSDLVSRRGRIRPAYGKVWPVTRTQLNAIRVRMIAGHATAAAIPADIIAALKLYVGHRYANREDVVVGPSVAQLPNAYQVVANRHRLSWF